MKKKMQYVKAERTISEAVFNYWQKEISRGDASALCILTGASRPTMDKALHCGFISKDGRMVAEDLEEKITNYFMSREMKREKNAKLVS